MDFNGAKVERLLTEFKYTITMDQFEAEELCEELGNMRDLVLYPRLTEIFTDLDVRSRKGYLTEGF
jgi:hypothetical protein